MDSTKSNFSDYRKKKFGYLASDLIENVPLDAQMKVLDFGCATGGLLWTFKQKGFIHLKGTDISYWAVECGHKMFGLTEELEYYNKSLLSVEFDVIFMLDVLEHVPILSDIHRFLELIRSQTKLVVRIPISIVEGDPYFLEVSRNDVTHVQCHTANWWHSLFIESGFKLDKILRGPAIYESDGVLSRVYIKVK